MDIAAPTGQNILPGNHLFDTAIRFHLRFNVSLAFFFIDFTLHDVKSNKAKDGPSFDVEIKLSSGMFDRIHECSFFSTQVTL